MKTKPTPGPWIYAHGSVYRQDTFHDESSIRIALMDRNEPNTVPTERDANARLIATAPELRDALCRLQNESLHYRDTGKGVEFLNAALDEAAIVLAKAS